ncbi:MAG: hypothetical protein FWC77_05220 [Defluviitaleaceae bacterium]|nr:hypothetical protein [Defluviitaleaceae bacterium]
MGIFDDDVKKINQQAEIKETEERKAIITERKRKKETCEYILRCLREFPVAARNSKLRTKKISIRRYIVFKSLNYNKYVDAYELNSCLRSRLYIDINGTCYLEKGIDRLLDISTYEEMSEELY